MFADDVANTIVESRKWNFTWMSEVIHTVISQNISTLGTLLKQISGLELIARQSCYKCLCLCHVAV